MRVVLLTFILGGLLSSLHAEELPKQLTWLEAVKMATDNNPDVAAARRTLEARSAAYHESFNGVLPQIGLTNSYSRSKLDATDANRWQARGTVSMDIFNTARYASISASDSQLEQARAQLGTAAAALLLNLKSSYASVLYSQKLIEVSKTILDIREKNASLVKLRYDSGRESKGNQLRTNAEFIQAEAAYQQAERDLEAARKELNRHLGLTATNYEVTADSRLIDSTAAMKPSFGPIVESHPAVLLKKAQLKNAEASLRESRSTLWPNVTASYSRSLHDSVYFPDDNPNWTASGVLSLPIFGGGPTSTFYAIKQADRSRKSAEEELRSARYQVESDLESSWSNYLSALDNKRVQEAFLEAARQRNEEADIRYSNGLMSYDDWERIVTDRVNFERSVIGSERDTVITAARWDNARGKQLAMPDGRLGE